MPVWVRKQLMNLLMVQKFFLELVGVMKRKTGGKCFQKAMFGFKQYHQIILSRLFSDLLILLCLKLSLSEICPWVSFLQLLLAIVYFKVFGVTTPRLVTVGYRSINGRLNIISTSLFTYVTNLRVDPCGGEVDVTVHNPTHSIRVRATASPKSFATLFGPTNKGTWEKICAESFSSKAEVGIWTRSDSLLTRFFNFFKTGLLGKSYLVENVEFEGAALEFGEDLICKDWLTSDGKAAKILEPTEVNKKLEL